MHIRLSLLRLAATLIVCAISSCSYGKNTLEIKTEKAYKLFKDKQYDKCIQLCDDALNRDKSYYQAYINKGKCLFMLNKYEEALGAYNNAIKIKPDSYEAYGAKGDILAELNKYEEALNAYNKAIAIKPNDGLKVAKVQIAT